MEEFKKCVIVESITRSLTPGCPLPRIKKLPQLTKNNMELFRSSFGEEGFNIYQKMNSVNKINALRWFETHGINTIKLYDAESLEDWNMKEIFKFDLGKLKQSNSDIYQKVVKNIMDRVYCNYPEDIYDIISKKFSNDPDTLSETMRRRINF